MKKLLVIFAATMLTFSCKNTADQAGVVEESKQAVIDSMNIEMAKKEAALARQKSIDSMQAVAAAAKRERVVVHHNVASAAPVAQAPAPAAKRKGWSGAAKGAVIGAGVGAIGGAVIDKKKPAQGAVIGGLAGAGLGAGTGAILDAEKKKKEAQQGQ